MFEGSEVIRVPIICRGVGKLRLVFNYISFALTASLIGVWRLRGRKFDAMFVYEPSPVTVGIPAALLRSVKKTPLVFWVLDLWPESLEAIGAVKSKLILYLIKRLVAFIYSKCDIILAQSKSFIAQIEKYSSSKIRIEYFPGWADHIENSRVNDYELQLKKEVGAFYVLFAGNIGEAQDFPAILKAAELLKGHSCIRWLIVGSGRMSEWVHQQIKLQNLEHCVFLLGRYPLEAMPSFFQFADALLVSLKNEPIFELTIPAKLQSYLNAARPIIGMLNGEGAKIISQSGAGIACSSGDSAGLASSILKLSNMSIEQRLKMGQKAFLFSQTEFNKKYLIDRLELILNEITLSPNN
jgi:glycosyltransferase involved in cell wall biosynthesis